MSKQIIFARARPSAICIVEQYAYQIDISALSDAQFTDAPVGLVKIVVPYDGYKYFTRQAMADVEIQFPQIRHPQQINSQIKARIGYLSLIEHDRTNLDDKYNLTLNHNILPLDVMVHNNELHWPHSLLSDRLASEIVIHYKPKRPDFPLLTIKARVSDTNSISEEEYHLFPEKKAISSTIMQQVSEQVGFERDLILEFELLLELPYSYKFLCKDIHPKLTQMGITWPVATSHRLVRLKLEGIEHPFVYNPDKSVVEWANIQFSLKEYQEGKETCLYTTPTIQLYVNEPGELYQWPQLYGDVEVEIPCLLSGLQAGYFDVLGVYQADTTIEQKTVINANLILNVEECFEQRLFSPQQHLQFPEVILEPVRRSDITMLLKDERFTCLVLKTPNPEQAYLIKATRPEGAGELTLWILVEGIPSQTTRERHIPGGESFTTNLKTGNTIVYMRGQLRGDSKRVVHVMNEIHEKLKDRFRHVQVNE